MTSLLTAQLARCSASNDPSPTMTRQQSPSSTLSSPASEKIVTPFFEFPPSLDDQERTVNDPSPQLCQQVTVGKDGHPHNSFTGKALVTETGSPQDDRWCPNPFRASLSESFGATPLQHRHCFASAPVSSEACQTQTLVASQIDTFDPVERDEQHGSNGSNKSTSDSDVRCGSENASHDMPPAEAAQTANTSKTLSSSSASQSTLCDSLLYSTATDTTLVEHGSPLSTEAKQVPTRPISFSYLFQQKVPAVYGQPLTRPELTLTKTPCDKSSSAPLGVSSYYRALPELAKPRRFGNSNQDIALSYALLTHQNPSIALCSNKRFPAKHTIKPELDGSNLEDGWKEVPTRTKVSPLRFRLFSKEIRETREREEKMGEEVREEKDGEIQPKAKQTLGRVNRAETDDDIWR